jgi:hypothetical protein
MTPIYCHIPLKVPITCYSFLFYYIWCSLYNSPLLRFEGRRTSWENSTSDHPIVSEHRNVLWYEYLICCGGQPRRLWRMRREATVRFTHRVEMKKIYSGPTTVINCRGMLQVPIQCNNTSHFTFNIIFSYFSVHFFLLNSFPPFF